MIMSLDVEQAFAKIQYPFMFKNSQGSGNTGKLPQIT